MARGGLLLVLTAVWSVLLIPCCGQHYQQLDLTTPSTTCSMSSKYTSVVHGDSLDCHGAINGNTRTVWKPKGDPNQNCIYTTDTDRLSFWQVDLGQNYNIHKITIYSDENGMNYMENVQVEVNRIVVSTFENSKFDIDNPKIITLDPTVTGQTVRLTRPGNNFVTICELQVEVQIEEGCDPGRYGQTCSERCGENCDGACDRGNGNCRRCKTGFYGQTCSERCGENCEGACNQNDGHCLRCESGWWGDKCDTECSAQCVGSCDAGDGHCSSCNAHFAPPLCTACVSGYYGDQCDQVCSEHCLPDNGKITCGQSNGNCTSGCSEGWYQHTCSERCGENCDGGCEKDTGACNVTASESSDKQDVGIIVGSIIGGLLGAGLLTGLFILLAACIVRKRRSREVPSSADPSGRRPEVEFSPENALPDTKADKTETTDPDGNYARLENYENPDDIRPYSMLQTDRGHNTNIHIHGDKEAVLYHNTSTTGDKTLYM